MQKQRKDKKLDFWWQRWTLWPNLNYSLPQNLSQPNSKIHTVYKPFIMWDSNSLVVYLHLIFCGHTWGHPYLLPNWLLLGLSNIILSGTSIQSISLPFFFSRGLKASKIQFLSHVHDIRSSKMRLQARSVWLQTPGMSRDKPLCRLFPQGDDSTSWDLKHYFLATSLAVVIGESMAFSFFPASRHSPSGQNASAPWYSAAHSTI